MRNVLVSFPGASRLTLETSFHYFLSFFFDSNEGLTEIRQLLRIVAPQSVFLDG
jgi:hypothetical protein